MKNNDILLPGVCDSQLSLQPGSDVLTIEINLIARDEINVNNKINQ